MAAASICLHGIVGMLQAGGRMARQIVKMFKSMVTEIKKRSSTNASADDIIMTLLGEEGKDKSKIKTVVLITGDRRS